MKATRLISFMLDNRCVCAILTLMGLNKQKGGGRFQQTATVAAAAVG
jgi:hypothetical protein